MENTMDKFTVNNALCGVPGVRVGRQLSYLQKKHKNLLLSVRSGARTNLYLQTFKRVNRENIFKVNNGNYKDDLVYLFESTMEITDWALKGKIYLRYLTVILAIMVSLNLLSPALYSMHIPFLPLPESIVKGSPNNSSQR
jgi:hypothetical protein